MFKLLTVSVQKLIERDCPAGTNLQSKPKHPWGVVLIGLINLKQRPVLWDVLYSSWVLGPCWGFNEKEQEVRRAKKATPCARLFPHHRLWGILDTRRDQSFVTRKSLNLVQRRGAREHTQGKKRSQSSLCTWWTLRGKDTQQRNIGAIARFPTLQCWKIETLFLKLTLSEYSMEGDRITRREILSNDHKFWRFQLYNGPPKST